MTGKTNLVLYLIFNLFFVGIALFNFKPADTAGLQVDTDQAYAARSFDQIEGEATLSSLHISDTTRNLADLPNHKLNWPDGCREKDYKKDVITVPCGNGWGG